MDFGLEPRQYIQIPDIEFKTKQKVHLKDIVLCKSADPTTKIKLISGDFYIAHPRTTRGFIRIARTEADCDNRSVAGYVSIVELLKTNKELMKNGQSV